MEESLCMDSQLLDVYQTVIVSPAASVATLLDENPGVINARAWHGLTLLHQIGMRGTDEAVITVLITRGADVDSRSQAGETPLHYACRKGSLPIVTMLLKHGADVRAVDNSGHGCMHYAAQGNTVMIMAYLHESLGMCYDGLSSAQQTPLHVAALHGHWQVAAYLLRKKRCDARVADIMGNTALHLAAMKGEAIICCLLVSSTGNEILKVTNIRNETPLGIAQSGTTTPHREVEAWLKSPVTHPRFLWWSKLILPPLLGCVVPVFLTNTRSIQLIYWVLVIISFGYWIHLQSHRLTHPSRWSNSARAGVFIWGISSNLTLYFCFLQPVTRNNWIVTWLAWTALFLIVLSLSAFYSTAPGMFTGEDQDWSPLQQGVTGSGFCDECEIIQKPGVRHCRICGKCYWRLQHHCLFLLRCVTAANDRYFLLLLFAIITSCVAYLSNVIVYIQQRLIGTETNDGSRLDFHLADQIWILAMLVADIICAVCCSVMVKIQLQNPYVWHKKHEQHKVTYNA